MGRDTTPPLHHSTPHHSTTSPFHHFTISPFHYFTTSPLHHFTIPLFHHFTTSPLHHSTTPPHLDIRNRFWQNTCESILRQGANMQSNTLVCGIKVKSQALLACVAIALAFAAPNASAVWQPGLLGGFHTAGAAVYATPPARTNVFMDCHAATNYISSSSAHSNWTPIWSSNRCWQYWGQVFLPAGTHTFGAKIDDNSGRPSSRRAATASRPPPSRRPRTAGTTSASSAATERAAPVPTATAASA